MEASRYCIRDAATSVTESRLSAVLLQSTADSSFGGRGLSGGGDDQRQGRREMERQAMAQLEKARVGSSHMLIRFSFCR